MSSDKTTLDLAKLRDTISPERLVRYEQASGSAGLRGALELYAWDVRVAGAFFEEIHYLEVVLRNAIHGRLTVMHGGEDWY